MTLVQAEAAKCYMTSQFLAAWKLFYSLPQKDRGTMRTESAEVLMRTQSADWRTKFLKSADWCNPVVITY